MQNNEITSKNIGIGMIFGMSFGILLGTIFNKVSWGIIIGNCVGATLGYIFHWKNNTNDHIENNKCNK